MNPILPRVMLIEAANRVGAQEVAFYGGENGYEYDVMKSIAYPSLVIVSHPGSYADLIDQIGRVLDRGVRRIALFSSEEVYRYLHESKGGTDGEIYHLIGVADNPFEIAHVAQFTSVRSVSTSVAMAATVAGIRFDPELGADYAVEIDVDNMGYSGWSMERAMYNHLCLLRWANGYNYSGGR